MVNKKIRLGSSGIAVNEDEIKSNKVRISSTKIVISGKNLCPYCNQILFKDSGSSNISENYRMNAFIENRIGQFNGALLYFEFTCDRCHGTWRELPADIDTKK